MSSADGKLYELLANSVSRELLARLVAADGPRTQRQLTAETGLNASTISRRMGELENQGLVRRASAHAPYELIFPETTRDVLLAVQDLALMILERESDALRHQSQALRAGLDDAVHHEPEAT